jgi:predicted transcriptional regulator YheO
VGGKYSCSRYTEDQTAINRDIVIRLIAPGAFDFRQAIHPIARARIISMSKAGT